VALDPQSGNFVVAVEESRSVLWGTASPWNSLDVDAVGGEVSDVIYDADTGTFIAATLLAGLREVTLGAPANVTTIRDEQDLPGLIQVAKDPLSGRYVVQNHNGVSALTLYGVTHAGTLDIVDPVFIGERLVTDAHFGCIIAVNDTDLTWLVPTTDCNNNGVHDGCDLSDATSQDCNNNGTPDECETVCLGDADCDGSLDDVDLTLLQSVYSAGMSAWVAYHGGQAPCPCQNVDLDGDGDLDYDDYLILEDAWYDGYEGCLGACCYEYNGAMFCKRMDANECGTRLNSTFYAGEQCLDICDRCDHTGCP
jgi:hypothetical protein